MNITKAIRKTTFVQSNGKIEIQNPKFPQGAKVELIVLFEDNIQVKSTEDLAIERLANLDNPSQLITIIESDQEIDENGLKK